MGQTGILPQKQTSAWWCSGGCSPCGGAADDNVHDAGESHHTFLLMLEPGNVFFTSGFRLFPDIVVDSKILGKISVQTKRSFVCCEGLKILLLFFTKSKSFPFLQELIIYFVEGGGAVNCMMARLVNSLGKLKMSQGTSITPLTIWSGGWSFLHKVVQILAIFQTKKLTINLTSKSIHCSPIDFDSARA